MPDLTNKDHLPHWYYPSGYIPCDCSSVHDLVELTGIITHVRSEVKCPECLKCLAEAKKTCRGCQYPGKMEHRCDPMMDYETGKVRS